MTVENLRLQRLQNLEHYRFAKNVLTLCRTANIAKLNPKLPELEKAIEMEDLALNPPVANELTPQVIALDEERDRAYQALMCACVRMLSTRTASCATRQPESKTWPLATAT